MKFEIDIPEAEIQKYLNRLVDMDNRSIHFHLQDVINKGVQRAVDTKLKEKLDIRFSEKIDEVIDTEITKAANMKIPGWAKRRVKELLESVRIASFCKAENDID